MKRFVILPVEDDRATHLHWGIEHNSDEAYVPLDDGVLVLPEDDQLMRDLELVTGRHARYNANANPQAFGRAGARLRAAFSLDQEDDNE